MTALFQLSSSGGNNSLNYVTGNGPSTNGVAPTWLPFPLSSHRADRRVRAFSFEGDLISTSAYGSNELIGVGTSITDGGYGSATIQASAAVLDLHRCRHVFDRACAGTRQVCSG